MGVRRILQVVYSLNVGGTETWLAELAARIDRSRYHLDFCIVGRTGAGHFADAVRARGSRIWECRLSRAWWRFERAFEAALRASPYDAVHAYIDPGIALRAADRAAVSIRIAHYRSTMPRQSTSLPYRIYDAWQSRMARNHATALLGVSEAVMDACVGNGWRSDSRAAVIPGSIDVAGIRQAASKDPSGVRAALGIAEGVPIVGHVGRLVPAKDQMQWLDAARSVRDQIPACRFVIVGDGELRDALESRAKQLGLSDCVTFTGFRSNVGAILGVFDVMLQTSAWEGMPRAVLEGMAAGVPVVASDIPSHRELLRLAEMIYAGGAPDAAKAVIRILNDAALRERVIDAQFSAVQRFDWPAVVAALQRIYDGNPPQQATVTAHATAGGAPCRT